MNGVEKYILQGNSQELYYFIYVLIHYYLE